MNGNDLFDALSGIDKVYIEEAAFEFHETPAKKQSRARIASIRKFVLIAVPSAAAFLIIAMVALPYLIPRKSSESAATAPMPAMEEASEEAASDGSFDAEAPAEAPAEAAAEAEPSATDSVADEYRRKEEYNTTLSPDSIQTLKPEAGSEESTAAEGAAPSEDMWEVSKADYSDGVLMIRCAGAIPEDLTEQTYSLIRLDVAAGEALVSEGKLSELTDNMTVTDDLIVIDLEKKAPEAGKYRLFIGDVYADFTIE